MKKAFNIAARLVLGVSLALGVTAGIATMQDIRALNSIDPVGRPLTAGEIALGQGIFGDTIPYAELRIHRAPHQGHLALTMGNDIYMEAHSLQGGDLSTASPGRKKVLVHELTHIWQEYALSAKDRLLLDLRTIPGRALFRFFDTASHYNYRPALAGGFKNMNAEQQAALVADYAEAREYARTQKDNSTAVYEGGVKRVALLEPVLRPHLPIMK